MKNLETTVDELNALLKSGKAPAILDVREPQEVAICKIQGALHIPMRDIPTRVQELPDPDQPLVVYCHHGMRSMSVVNWLRQAGWAEAVSLRGGIDEWAAKYDPRMVRY